MRAAAVDDSEEIGVWQIADRPQIGISEAGGDCCRVTAGCERDYPRVGSRCRVCLYASGDSRASGLPLTKGHPDGKDAEHQD
jgi:hypothetical protein